MNARRTGTLIAIAVVATAVAVYLLRRDESAPEDRSPPPAIRTREAAPSRPIAEADDDRTKDAPPVVDRTEFANGANAPTPELGAIVEGRVADQFGAPLAAGRAYLVGLRESSRPEDSARPPAPVENGAFRFERVSPGDYDVVLAPDALPAGFAPPHDQRTRVAPALKESTGPGYFATRAPVASRADRLSVQLQVWRKVKVSGRVRTTAARPVPGAFVRLSSIRPGLQGLYRDATTDADGVFACDGAIPGVYRASVSTDDVAAEFRGLARPVPTDFEIPHDASAFEVPTIFLGGDVDVVGRVVNVEGEPFADGLVVCYANEPVVGGRVSHNWNSESLRTRTGSDGRFRLAGLPRAKFVVQIEPEGAMPADGGVMRRLVAHSKPSEIDLAGALKTVDLGLLTVDESKPFHVAGRVAAADGAALGADVLTRLVVVVEPEAGFVNARPAPGRPDPAPKRLRLDAAGRFDWFCETPYPAVDLRVATADGKRTSPSRRVTPVPRGKAEVVLSPP